MDPSLEVIHARRTESLDAPEILKLAGPTTERIFGRVNVVNIMYVFVVVLLWNGYIGYHITQTPDSDRCIPSL